MKSALDFYAAIGAALFPIPAGSKNPTGIVESFVHDCSRDPAQWAKWATDNPGCNFGVVAGPSTLIIVDVDCKDGREAAWALWCELCASWGVAVFTPHVQSARGGWHILFKVPDGVDATALRQPDAVKGIINIRAGNGYVVAAGSYYDGTAKGEQSGPYALLHDSPPYLAPDALVKHCTRAERTTAAPVTGSRNPGDTAALIKWLAERSAFEAYEDWLSIGMALKLEFGDAGLDIWQLSHDDTVTPDVETGKWNSFATEPTASSVTLNSWMKRAHEMGWSGSIGKSVVAMFDGAVAALPASLPNGVNSLVAPRGEVLPYDSDETLSTDFISHHIDDLRFNAETGRWLRWDGARWKPDKTGAAYFLIRKFLRDLAIGLVFTEARKVASAQKVAAVERMARTDPRVATVTELWDADPWIICTPGGVVDLRTGQVRASSPNDHATKITAAAPFGDCPQFENFLNRSLGGDADLIAFLQRALGYSLTGVVDEHAMFFVFGLGQNGKGVLLNSIAGIFGDYGRTASAETFLASKNDRHPTDVAGLAGSRLVVASEVPKGRAWDEVRLKSLTGGDRITARYMRQDFFDFMPQFKLWIAGNHRPRLTVVDEAVRRRLNFIEFKTKIPESERDPKLTEKLKAEWGGVLRWLVDGCLAWQRIGLKAPASVKLATDNYLSSQDAFAAWIEERCELKDDAWTSRATAFTSWRFWASSAGENVGSRVEFLDALRNRDFEESGRKGERGFKGLFLKPPAADIGSRIINSAAGLPPLPKLGDAA
jgi:P4 family phage/plasmid primase-like protien